MGMRRIGLGTAIALMLGMTAVSGQDAPPAGDPQPAESIEEQAGPRWAGASPLAMDERFDALLANGLLALDMNRADLTFDKRLLPDVKYQLEAMKASMDDPLAMPDVAGYLVGNTHEWMGVDSELLDAQRWETLWSRAENFTALHAELSSVASDDADPKALDTLWQSTLETDLPDWIAMLQPDQKQPMMVALIALKLLHDQCTSVWNDQTQDLAYRVPGAILPEMNGAKSPAIADAQAYHAQAVASFYPSFGKQSKHTPETAQPLDLISTIAMANMAWQHYLPQIAQHIARLHVPGLMPLIDSDETRYVTSGATTLLTLSGDADHEHHHLQASALHIDLGGRDYYEGKVAVADNHQRYAALFDFGDGDDVYKSGYEVMAYEIGPDGKPADPELVIPRLIGPCAAQGGSAILYDQAGNDRYEGGDFSLGAAMLGASTLHDAAGNDTYVGGQFTQGAAFMGWACLLDEGVTPAEGENVDPKRGSNDSYSCERYGQAFGYVLGYGRLEDTGGNDRYFAGGRYRHTPLLPDHYQSLSQGFGFGSRGLRFGGGIGALIDRGGNDAYIADVYAQGASYFYALGIAWDQDGNDTWQMGQYGQGAGIHLSAGLLFDGAGDDYYNNLNGVGTGGAHDYAVGWLIELEGNDSYYSNGLAQGLNNSVAVFYEKSGDDTYASRADVAIGAGTNNSVAFLLDGEGSDRYTIPMTNGLTQTRRTYGVIVDALGEGEEAPKRRAGTLSRLDAQVADNGGGDAEAPSLRIVELPQAGWNPQNLNPAELQKLWEIACRWQVGTDEYKAEITDARKKLVEEGNLEFLLGKLNEGYGLNVRALQATIPQYGNAAAHAMLERLQSDSNGTVQRNCIDLITRIYSLYDNACVHAAPTRRGAEDRELALEYRDAHRAEIMPKLLEFVREMEGNVKLAMLEHCTRYEIDVADEIAPFAESESDRARLKAAQLLGKSETTPAAFALLSKLILGDEYFAVRKAAFNAMNLPEFETPAAWDEFFAQAMEGQDQAEFQVLASENTQRFLMMMQLTPQIQVTPEGEEIVTQGDAACAQRIALATQQMSDGMSDYPLRLAAIKLAMMAVDSISDQPEAVVIQAISEFRAELQGLMQSEREPTLLALGYEALDQTAALVGEVVE